MDEDPLYIDDSPMGMFKYYSPFQKALIFVVGVGIVMAMVAGVYFGFAKLFTPGSTTKPEPLRPVITAKPQTSATPRPKPVTTPAPVATGALPIPNQNTNNGAGGIVCLPPQQPQVAKVVSVTDGDTIDVLIDGSIFPLRYIGMDTPETHFGTEPFGLEAAARNKALVLGKQVFLYRDVSNTDDFNRLLRYVVVGDVFVNAQLVREGLAQAKRYPPDTACAADLDNTQAVAFAAGLGMWAASAYSSRGNSGDGGVSIVAVDKAKEVVTIQNNTEGLIDLTGWSLVSERGSESCKLGGDLQAGSTLRIWSNTGDGFSCNLTNAIWNNSEPDPAVLYDAENKVVDRYP